MCQTQIANQDQFVPFKDDPTKTVGIRKRYIAQMNVRFRKLKGRINQLVINGNSGEFIVPSIDPDSKLAVINSSSVFVTNAGYDFGSDPRAIAEFMAWLQLQVDDVIFGNREGGQFWQKKHIDQAYLAGIKNTKAQLRKAGLTAEQIENLTPAQIRGIQDVALGFTTGSGIDLKTIHLDTLRLLYTRNLSDLEGVTETMGKQIVRAIVEGVEDGLGSRAIAKMINDRVDKIGLVRAKLIARTETARAHNKASINEFKEVAKELDIQPLYEWNTAGDERVRSKHRDWDSSSTGKFYTEAQVSSMIGEPNCRCGVSPHIPSEFLEEVA